MTYLWVISGFSQCFNYLVFMFMAKGFHCNCKFYGTVSINADKLIMV